MRYAVLLLLFAPTVHADDAAVAVVNKALKATAWDTRTSNNATWKDSGKMILDGNAMTYTGEFHVTYPDKYRFSIAIKVAGNDFIITAGIDGDKAWETGMGKTEDIKGDKLSYLQSEVYQMYVMSLRPLVDPKSGISVTMGTEAVVGTAKCVGIVAKKEGKPDVKLWFDAATGLPAKMECKVKNEFDGWKEATDEMYLSDWADADGMKVFKKFRIDRNGKPMIESNMSDYKTPEKVDAKLYEKP